MPEQHSGWVTSRLNRRVTQRIKHMNNNYEGKQGMAINASAIEHLTASAALAEMAAGRLTAEALVDACLARILARESDVAAWTFLASDNARQAARSIDGRRKAGDAMPPLAGIPIGIKDVIDTSDIPTEYGSPIFAGNQPSADAFLVSALKAAGAIILGKTVTTEFAFFGPGKTRNPHDPARTPGGSSSGSAAAVADDQVPLAIGTQTAGSLIRPASYCGVIGFKPTFGYTSRTGVLAQSAPLDTIGGYARSVEDIALLFDVISSFDSADRDMASGKKSSLVDALRGESRRVPRFAFVRAPAWPQADKSMKAAFEDFANSFGARAEVVEIDLHPDFDDGLRLSQIIQFSDIAKNYGPHADAHPGSVSQKLKDTIAEGRSFSAADYAAARAEQDHLYELLRPILVNHDAILTPAAAGVAPKGLESTGSPAFNAVWTYLGMPCISLPLLEAEGLPVGVQVTAARGHDGGLLRVANWLMRQKA